MSKARWGRFFGLPRNRWSGRDQARRPLPEDCETVITPPVLKQAGVTNPGRGLRALLADPRFHHYLVRLPGGRMVKATHPTSLHWIVEVRRDEGHERSRANLMVGSQAPIETIVTKPQGSGAPFVPEIWQVPIAPHAPRPSAPLRETRPQADRTVAVVTRNDDPELEKEMLLDDARRLLTTNGPLDLAAITAGLRLSRGDRVALARALRADGAIIGVPTEGGRLLYHVAP